MSSTAGLRPVRLALGNLNNGANAGRRYANLNNDLGNANWNYGARNSEENIVPCLDPLEGSPKGLARNGRN